MFARLLPLLAVAAFTLSACAQDVPDLDRTQPNRLAKAELLGSDWYVAQTVTHVPTTDFFSFIGETGMLERVRWDIQEDYLIAYRAYPRIEGADPSEAAVAAAVDAFDPNDPNATPPEQYLENPVAAFPIQRHFDIQRSYNAATGEQTNVIDENSSDRPWYEREYIRVDWSRNLITNYEFITEALYYTNLSYFVSEEQGGPDAMVRDFDEDGALNYFDFVSKVHIEPDIYGCLYQWYGWWPGDCTSGEIKIRNSFVRVDQVREYEPVQYDDRLMSKFGYFRTERFGWDPWRGIRQSNRSFLPNRFSIWEEVWQKDEDGNVAFDDEGWARVIPIAERTPKPIVYYVSRTLPDDLWPSAERVAADWDVAFRRTVAVSQNRDIDDVEPMFVVCRNPVTEDDAEVCGEPGMSPRIGDIRYNTMYWVDQYTQAGLLGYGPSGADPLTGETIFGSAYVYGAEVDEYSQWATDLVRLINGDLTDSDIEFPDYIREEIHERLTADPAQPGRGRNIGERPRALRDIPIGSGTERLLTPDKKRRLNALKRNGIEDAPFERNARVMRLMKEHGLDELLMNDETEIMATRGQFGPRKRPTDDVKQHIAPSNWASATHLNHRKEMMMEAAKRNLYLRAFADDAIVGLATSYEGETDYEKVRAEIRAAVFEAVMLHEVGHTIGLRHNFAGSYDSLNYHDEYWALRGENLGTGRSLDDLYEMATPTQAQIDGRMMEYQYSSIMDYGQRFNSDIQGLGKYDVAAIMFGYSTGTYDEAVGQESGYVEVYSNPGAAKRMLRDFEDPPSLAYPTTLEEYHYTTVANAFGGLDRIAQRETLRYDDLLERRETEGADAPAEVSYMFCSDEWAGILVSCDVFDSGADPFEIARNYLNNYRNYYAINHFHRDRVFLWSEDILYSMYMRYFSPLTYLYQNWVFAYVYGTSDVQMDDYYLFAAMAGFNLLADVLLTPPSGSYFQDVDGIYYNYWDEPEPDADVVVPRGVGQPLYTDYQWDSGYYYFDRTREIGHFWDYLAALFAITDSEAMRLGVDTAADELAYSIPWYLFFEFELHDIMNTIYGRDTRIAGPYVDGDEVVKNPLALLVADDGAGGEILFDPETGREVFDRPAGAGRISLDTTFTQELYAALYGMAFFTSNYSQNFPDNFKVFRLGAGEALEAGDGFETISFTDPDSGYVYAAIAPIGSTFDSGGTLLIKQGIEWIEMIETGSEEDADYAYYQLRDVVDRINLLRSLYDIFGWTFY